MWLYPKRIPVESRRNVEDEEYGTEVMYGQADRDFDPSGDAT